MANTGHVKVTVERYRNRLYCQRKRGEQAGSRISHHIRGGCCTHFLPLFPAAAAAAARSWKRSTGVNQAPPSVIIPSSPAARSMLTPELSLSLAPDTSFHFLWPSVLFFLSLSDSAIMIFTSLFSPSVPCFSCFYVSLFCSF